MIAPRVQTRRLDVLAPWISTAARLVVGGVLLVAGALKVIDLPSSVAAVAAYELVPGWAERLIGWVLPFLELGLRAVARRRAVHADRGGDRGPAGRRVPSRGVRRGRAQAQHRLRLLRRGGQVAPGQTAYAWEIVRDLGLLALCGWLVWRPRSRFALDHREDQT